MIIDSTETSQTSTFAEPENTPVNAEISKPLSAKAQGKQPAKMSQDPRLYQDPETRQGFETRQAHQALSIAETFGASTQNRTPGASWPVDGLFYEIKEVEGVVRNGFTTSGNCKKLLAQEGVREVYLRGERDMKLGRTANVEAILGQSRGAMEGQECDGCAEGIGPFTTCVTAEGMFGGSCTNCHFGSRGKKCSFRSEETEKRPKRSAKKGRD